MMELTPEDREVFSRVFKNIVLPNLPAEEILADLKPKDRMAGLKPEELDEIEACLRKIREKNK
ncbi:MAG: hypothetical protein GY749_06700 [Desulfobacteraceae bacterium]|nr:hypothetical protein [Desulfobacteraceae bacterium]